MGRNIYRIAGTVTFPEGIMPGEGGKSNHLTVAINGMGTPVLRGTAIAGALRAGCDETMADTWFGKALNGDNDESVDSRIIVADMILEMGQAAVGTRTHNLINRHTGAVADGGLFSLESLPPGTTGKLLLYINSRLQETEEEQLIEQLAGILGSGLTLGGNRNRGIGRLDCVTPPTLHTFDIDAPEGYAAWMNARYADRMGTAVCGGKPLALTTAGDSFVLDITLGIPRGEDFVIGYGATVAHQAEPQKVKKADGKEYWRIPGSTVRGIFRGWMTRLAVLDGHRVRDDADAFFEKREITGELIGWGFEGKNTRAPIKDNPDLLADPVLSLFGSFYRRGRIHFADALSLKPIQGADTQVRKHVAIDRFSGGANEGMLFDNTVLVGGVEFALRITIDTPSPEELVWLEKTIKALHLGVISVGSSKGSGWLEVKSCTAGSIAGETVTKNISAFVEVQK